MLGFLVFFVSKNINSFLNRIITLIDQEKVIN